MIAADKTIELDFQKNFNERDVLSLQNTTADSVTPETKRTSTSPASRLEQHAFSKYFKNTGASRLPVVLFHKEIKR